MTSHFQRLLTQPFRLSPLYTVSKDMVISKHMPLKLRKRQNASGLELLLNLTSQRAHACERDRLKHSFSGWSRTRAPEASPCSLLSLSLPGMYKYGHSALCQDRGYNKDPPLKEHTVHGTGWQLTRHIYTGSLGCESQWPSSQPTLSTA